MEFAPRTQHLSAALLYTSGIRARHALCPHNEKHINGLLHFYIKEHFAFSDDEICIFFKDLINLIKIGTLRWKREENKLN